MGGPVLCRYTQSALGDSYNNNNKNTPAHFSVLFHTLANQAGEAGLTILAKVVDVDGDGWVSVADVEVCLEALYKESADLHVRLPTRPRRCPRPCRAG